MKMEERALKLNRYFDGQIASCELRRKELLDDGRTDEAVFERIKENVYDIFRKVLFAACKNSNEDADAARCFFLQKLEQIASDWKVSYEKAKEHDDAVKAQIEEIKLCAAGEIRENFVMIWEEEQ